MATQATKQAIDATRETNGIVEIVEKGDDNKYVYAKWSDDIPVEADHLVQKGFLISPSSRRKTVFTVFKKIN